MWTIYDVLFRVMSECRSNHLFAQWMRVWSNIKFLCIKCFYPIAPKFLMDSEQMPSSQSSPTLSKLLIWWVLILSHRYHNNSCVESEVCAVLDAAPLLAQAGTLYTAEFIYLYTCDQSIQGCSTKNADVSFCNPMQYNADILQQRLKWKGYFSPVICDLMLLKSISLS